MNTKQIQDAFSSGHPRALKQPVASNDKLELTFFMKHNNQETTPENLHNHPAKRNYLSHATHAEAYAADEQGIEILREFMTLFEIEIVSVNPAQQKVVVSGTIQQYINAFDVPFSVYTAADGEEHLSYEGVLNLPPELRPYVLSISGLEKGLTKGERTPLLSETAQPEKKGYSPQQIEKAYSFPGTDAEGECIGLIELGGDYKLSDLQLYCKTYNLPVPQIVEVGTKPAVPPKSQEVDNLEVSLDIQLVAGLASKAKIVLYYAPSIPEAIHLALHDSENNPSVLSVSWAISEMVCSPSEREMINQVCYQAAQKGITIVAASGDYGAYNHMKYPNVMLPASNPCVIGCGGTALHLPEGTEEVWNTGSGLGSGGGYSAIYQPPSYQQNAIAKYKQAYFPYGINGAGVPDVAANSALTTAYNIAINGKIQPIGAGTSAATPVWASLIARLNKKHGYRLGWINDMLYKLEGSKAFLQVLKGNNGFYPAGFGWSPTTGLGAPNGEQLSIAIDELENLYHPEEEEKKTTPSPVKKPAAKTKAPAKKTTRTRKKPEDPKDPKK